MIQFDLPKQKSSIIKVLGVGGGGSNAVNFMHKQDVDSVDFVICNTDSKALEQSDIPNKIQLGPNLTQGLGAGANPEVGKKATEESLQEIKNILEVNTKMAFITAGMGGGTGTGGAPIIAQVCKEMGILTVGIVTTPFSFEGPRRMKQAEEGIQQLKPYVDTLLVISNDKLRMQYGNLKMKDAFSKADNILATAAKCITDIINSRGHIIVDFADVSTVMRNGGVAILGKAEAEGEDRAQNAIEEALNSPLLNDSDIRGAKWILININSAEGEHECTMDELEIINTYLRMQAGDEADVIVGMGYDETLDRKISITLIATGFDAKDPFFKPVEVEQPKPVEEKIIMTLGVEGEEKKMTELPKPLQQQVLPFDDEEETESEITPVFNEEGIPMPQMKIIIDPYNSSEIKTERAKNNDDNEVVHFELTPEITNRHIEQPPVPEVKEPIIEKKEEEVLPHLRFVEHQQPILSKPANIYAEQKERIQQPEEKPIVQQQPVEKQKEEEITEQPVMPEMFLSEKEVEPEVPKAEMETKPPVASNTSEQDNDIDEGEAQRRKAAERIQKLRNLSFNMNTADPNSEFDSVPAYIRRNMELFGNTLTSVENFYSKYTVNKDENDKTHISTINTFLDGKKPD